MISILLSVHNGAHDLPKTLESIIQQTYSNWELIAVDDASSDETGAILKSAQKRFPGKVRVLINTPNLGLTRSLVRAEEAAKGEFLARLDSGDTYDARKLEKQRAFLVDHPEHGVVGCAYVNHSENGGHARTYHPSETDTEIRKTILKRNPFAHSAVLLRRSIYQRAGGYNPAIRYAQDYDLWFRLLQHGKAANLSEVLCFRTINPGSISYQKQKEQMRQCLATRWKYMNKRNPLHYLYLLEPLGVALTPLGIKRWFRTREVGLKL
jgi:glycosyltransferase involved in cell wall biosynthesis